MVNVLLLALIDLVIFRVPLLRKVAVSHAVTAALATILMTVAVFAVLSDMDITIGWVGLDSILLIVMYFVGIWLIQRENNGPSAAPGPAAVTIAPGFPTLKVGLIGFAVAAGFLMAAVPTMVAAQKLLILRAWARVCGHGAAQHCDFLARTGGGHYRHSHRRI
ncbi:MAG: hypothetical protein M5U34_26665 [Chloroflexi bacterium]|nr:hypothetical protein [Chloroflexota bacterium]